MLEVATAAPAVRPGRSSLLLLTSESQGWQHRFRALILSSNSFHEVRH
jgi:hypothetical protein